MEGLTMCEILLLVLLNGLFAMAELAVVSSRRSRLQQMVEEVKHAPRQILRAMTIQDGL